MQIPSTLQEQQEMGWAFLPKDDSNSRIGPYGSTGKELVRLEKEIRDYWELSCRQSNILRQPHETIPYEPIPPKRTFTVPVRYYLRGRGEPPSYQIDDKE